MTTSGHCSSWPPDAARDTRIAQKVARIVKTARSDDLLPLINLILDGHACHIDGEGRMWVKLETNKESQSAAPF